MNAETPIAPIPAAIVERQLQKITGGAVTHSEDGGFQVTLSQLEAEAFISIHDAFVRYRDAVQREAALVTLASLRFVDSKRGDV